MDTALNTKLPGIERRQAVIKISYSGSDANPNTPASYKKPLSNPMIDSYFLDKLRAQADIVFIIGELWEIKKAGSNYKGCCPFHTEKSPSFSVSPSKQIFKCYGCGKGGDLFRFVQDFKRLTFSEAVHYVADRYNETVIYERPINRTRSRFHDLDL
ncbi:CHC2 zinc finger domain-containing protein [Spirosoma endbachense]|uniref:Zinc finger CHC2-type domain-containing protein n=1 Tax=Spirosoma endbachense TaxID=2666025 RepID=A0A6P1VXN0_9BACT|nr:CHC2 zinc finger domain-containing protein [Spirosoma endbachense]QHV97873.1 hypothetical protein GJR95_23965 [Spirosoma endbachense]